MKYDFQTFEIHFLEWGNCSQWCPRLGESHTVVQADFTFLYLRANNHARLNFTIPRMLYSLLHCTSQIKHYNSPIPQRFPMVRWPSLQLAQSVPRSKEPVSISSLPSPHLAHWRSQLRHRFTPYGIAASSCHGDKLLPNPLCKTGKWNMVKLINIPSFNGSIRGLEEPRGTNRPQVYSETVTTGPFRPQGPFAFFFLDWE